MNTPTGKLRYRTTWTGKLVLQVEVERETWAAYFDLRPKKHLVWRDARVQDFPTETLL